MSNYILELKWRCSTKTTNLVLKCFLPAFCTMAIAVLLAYCNFFPPFPRTGLINDIVKVAVIGIIATWIRYTDNEKIDLNDSSVSLSARIEWVKEKLSLWRTIAVSGALGILWFVVEWMKYGRDQATTLVRNEHELYYLNCVAAVQIFSLYVYIFLGPIYECIKKSREIRNMLLKIKEPEK